MPRIGFAGFAEHPHTQPSVLSGTPLEAWGIAGLRAAKVNSKAAADWTWLLTSIKVVPGMACTSRRWRTARGKQSQTYYSILRMYVSQPVTMAIPANRIYSEARPTFFLGSPFDL